MGRHDLPLNTAVGMPICSVGMDLCILVLFAVESIEMSTNAVEFLNCIARAVYEQERVGFLPSSISSIVTCAQTEQFIGIWDMRELLTKYTREVDFHLMPIDKLQRFFDVQEHYTLLQLFGEFRDTRDNHIGPRQLQLLRNLRLQTHESELANASSSTSATPSPPPSSPSSPPSIPSSSSSPLFSSNSSTILDHGRRKAPPVKNKMAEDWRTVETSSSLDILFSCGLGAFIVDVDESMEQKGRVTSALLSLSSCRYDNKNGTPTSAEAVTTYSDTAKEGRHQMHNTVQSHQISQREQMPLSQPKETRSNFHSEPQPQSRPQSYQEEEFRTTMINLSPVDGRIGYKFARIS